MSTTTYFYEEIRKMSILCFVKSTLPGAVIYLIILNIWTLQPHIVIICHIQTVKLDPHGSACICLLANQGLLCSGIYSSVSNNSVNCLT